MTEFIPSAGTKSRSWEVRVSVVAKKRVMIVEPRDTERWMLMEQTHEKKPAKMTAPQGQSKQAGETQARWGWVERSVWTGRMLQRLEQSQEQTVWFSLWDMVWDQDNLSRACLEVILNKK